MKQLFGLWWLGLLVFSVSAAASQDAADIEALLPAEPLRMARSEMLSGRFVQTKTLADLQQPLRSSGRFIYAREHGVLWNVQKPFAEEYVFADDRLVVRGGGPAPAFGREVARLLTALFTLDFTTLERSFAIEGERSKTGWSLRLVPRHRALSAALAEIRLEGQRHLQRVSIFDADGNLTRIELKDLRVLKSLPAGTLERFQ